MPPPRKEVCRHDQSSARHSYATPLEQFTENRINFAPVMHLAHDEAPVEIAHRFICPPKITACGEHSPGKRIRSEEHTSELQSLMRLSYAVFCLKKKRVYKTTYTTIRNKE